MVRDDARLQLLSRDAGVDPNKQEPLYLVLAAATLIESIYDAYAESPSAEQVAAPMTAGYPDVHEMHGKSPYDILDHVRDSQNKFNQKGCGTSFLEKYNKCEEIEQLWQEIRKAGDGFEDEEEAEDAEGQGDFDDEAST